MKETRLDCLKWRDTGRPQFSVSEYSVPQFLTHFCATCAAILQPIRYPIEDSQVKPTASDPPLSDRPVPSTDFLLPMECMGQLLMVWDFCSLFGKALLLSSFTLEDFEKALDYREGEAPLLLEMSYALLRAALTDPLLKDEFWHKRKRRTEVSSVTRYQFLRCSMFQHAWSFSQMATFSFANEFSCYSAV